MANSVSFDPHKLMKLAIKVMRQSVAEVRADSKAIPMVGAVIWKPDGTINTACRGELRSGDHAEYTLLERKNCNNKLDGSMLFTTLEPCAPGARNPSKVCCAERIVLARIKEVWVGIEDPDPTVDRKGIQYLQDRGVIVHMFDRELQEEIQEANSEFIEQAMERAAAAREWKRPKDVTLSTLEDHYHGANKAALSIEALGKYREILKIAESAESEFDRSLINQGVFKDVSGRIEPTGFGLVLFGKKPREFMQQAGLLGTFHFIDGTEELKDFDGPQVFAPSEALDWLRSKLPNPIKRTEAWRQETNEAFFELVREGIVNALVHRDYSIREAKSQLIATPDFVTIKSPGKPVPPITLEKMQSFSAPMLSRNPVLHYVFAKMRLAEERGLGLKSMKTRAQTANLPLPRYKWEEPYLILTIYRTDESAVASLSPDVLESLSKSEREGWRWLGKQEGMVSISEYAEAMKLPKRTAQNHMSRFAELRLVERIGVGRTTRYRITPR